MDPGMLFFMCVKVATAAALLCVVLPSAMRNDEPAAFVLTAFAVAVLVGAACQDANAMLLAAGATP